jgi:hypothetical protein
MRASTASASSCAWGSRWRQVALAPGRQDLDTDTDTDADTDADAGTASTRARGLSLILSYPVRRCSETSHRHRCARQLCFHHIAPALALHASPPSSTTASTALGVPGRRRVLSFCLFGGRQGACAAAGAEITPLAPDRGNARVGKCFSRLHLARAAGTRRRTRASPCCGKCGR